MKNIEVPLLLLCIIILVGVLQKHVKHESIDRKISALNKFMK